MEPQNQNPNMLIQKIRESWQYYAISLFIGIILGGGIMMLLKGGGFGGRGVDPYPPRASAVGGDWLAKIDDYAISKADFEEGYKFFMNQIPAQQRMQLPDESVIKKQYFDTLVGQYIVTIKALNEGLAGSREGQLLLKTALRQAIYQIYLNKNIPQDPSVFAPSKAEIDQYNRQYSSQFDKLGLNAEQRRQYATQEISQRKMQAWAAEFINQIRENYKVQRNPDMMNKIGISQTPQGGGLLSPTVNP